MNFLLALGLSIGMCQSAFAITLSEQVKAAKKTATTEASCVLIKPFYWEIGDELSALVSGSSGIGAPTAKTSLDIASASKWIFSAYVVEKRSGALTSKDKDALRFLSGYDQFSNCFGSSTVARCFKAVSNYEVTPAHVGKFSYSGGHMQKLAVDMGLGEMNSRELASEINYPLKTKVSFNIPQPAGGMETTSQDYGFFLRRLLNRELKLGEKLATDAVEASNGPAPQNWKYSYGHWVEAGEKVVSSPGLFGFYPWIDKSKKLYGIIGRKSFHHNAYLKSIECGQKIRHAFITGK